MLAAPTNHPAHHPPSCTSPSFPFPFFPPRRLFLSRNLDEDPSGRDPAYDSGSSAKLIRFGVERPELGALPNALATPTPSRSGMLVVEGDSAGVPFGDGCFIADCLGGDWGRVDEECFPLVKRRDMDAVAVEVPASATGAGVRGRKAGGRGRSGGVGGVGGGWSSRILRRLTTVSFARHPSDEEEDSSVGGVIGRWGSVGMICFGVWERDERLLVDPPVSRGFLSGDFFVRADEDREWVLALVRSVLVLVFLELRRDEDKKEGRENDEGADEPGEGTLATNEDSMLYAGVDGSKGRLVTLGDASVAWRLRLEEEAAAEGLQSEDGWEDGGQRRPSVEGSTIESESDAATKYCVSARGAGEIRSDRSWMRCRWGAG